MRATHEHWNTDTMKLGVSTVNIYTTESHRVGFVESVDCAIKFLAVCRFQKWEKIWEGVRGYFRTLYRKGEEEEEEGGVVRCE